MADWEDLSDEELEERLSRRISPNGEVDPLGIAVQLVASRDEEDIAILISEMLDA